MGRKICKVNASMALENAIHCHQNRVTLFLKFLTFFFAKTKDFPKTTKTLKNLFEFDQQGLSMWKHI